MSKGMNKVFLMGRLTRDPETRTTPSGKNVTNFALAVDKFGKDAGTDFFDVTAWEKLGDTVQRYLTKGSQAIVEGRLDQQSWEQDGVKRSKIVVIALDVTFLGGDKDRPSASNQNDTRNNDEPINLDDVPF